MERQRKQASWRRSSYCDAGACIEVSLSDAEIAVRDSTDPSGPVLQFDPTEWAGFIAGLEQLTPSH